MTGVDILNLSLALLGEPKETAEDYRDYSLAQLNVILAECFPVQNALLVSRGESPFLKLFQLDSLGGDVPYDDMLVVSCMSYGLAAKLVLEDSNEIAKFNYFTQMYVEAMANNSKWISEPMQDFYGGVAE